MIRLVNASMFVQVGGRFKTVLCRASAEFPAYSRTSIICDPGSAKTALARVLQKIEVPNRGHVVNDFSLSPVIGGTRSFNPYLSAAENVQIHARILGRDPRSTLAFVDQFTELGAQLNLAVRLLSPIKKAKIGYALSYAMHFLFLLAEDSVGTGDADFRLKCDAILHNRLQKAGLIFLTSQASAAEKYCNRHFALVLGRLLPCRSAEEAFDLTQICKAG